MKKATLIIFILLTFSVLLKANMDQHVNNFALPGLEYFLTDYEINPDSLSSLNYKSAEKLTSSELKSNSFLVLRKKFTVTTAENLYLLQDYYLSSAKLYLDNQEINKNIGTDRQISKLEIMPAGEHAIFLTTKYRLPFEIGNLHKLDILHENELLAAYTNSKESLIPILLMSMIFFLLIILGLFGITAAWRLKKYQPELIIQFCLFLLVGGLVPLPPFLNLVFGINDPLIINYSYNFLLLLFAFRSSLFLTHIFNKNLNNVFKTIKVIYLILSVLLIISGWFLMPLDTLAAIIILQMIQLTIGIPLIFKAEIYRKIENKNFIRVSLTGFVLFTTTDIVNDIFHMSISFPLYSIGILFLVAGFSYLLLEHYLQRMREIQIVKLQLSNNQNEILRLQEENLKSELAALKAQLNPHFLFNSLNTLSFLLEENQAAATSFVKKLAEIYRYVLEHSQEELVSLNSEINFAEAYAFLLRYRFQEALNIEIDIAAENNFFKVIPLCLQLCLENAVKHNVISSKKPLRIKVYCKENNLVIENNLQIKNSLPESCGTGLENLKMRYSFFTDQPISIFQDEQIFRVSMPLIKE